MKNKILITILIILIIILCCLSGIAIKMLVQDIHEKSQRQADYNAGIRYLDEITTEINDIQSYIDKKMYLEALEICNQTKERYTLKEDAATRIEELSKTATDKYNAYKATLKKNSAQIATELNQIQSYINNGQYNEAINMCDSVKSTTKLTDDAISSLDSLRNTASSKHTRQRIISIVNQYYPYQIQSNSTVHIQNMGGYYSVGVETPIGEFDRDEFGCKVNLQTGIAYDPAG